MSGGPKYEYLWQDGSKFKKPTKLPANQYISLLMDWIEGQVNDTAIFPLTDDVPFPKNFSSVCKKVTCLHVDVGWCRSRRNIDPLPDPDPPIPGLRTRLRAPL